MNLLLSDPAFLSVAAAVSGGGGYDADAQAYITAVEAADAGIGATGGLETAVKDAINSFFVGCKSDGIWNAIKASCILAGARTFAGALTPLSSSMPSPTNVGFGGTDYNRKTGLQGDGSAKYLDSGRSNSADPQNSRHMSVYLGEQVADPAISKVHMGVIGAGYSQVGASVIATDDPAAGTGEAARFRASGSTAALVTGGRTAGFRSVSRNSSSAVNVRHVGASSTISSNSETPVNANLYLFARNAILANSGSPIDSYSNARIAFYSIGESLNLELLDARVTTLINAFASAIP